MDWMEVVVHTTSQGADLVSEILISRGSQGTMIIDKADIPPQNQPHGYWEIFDENILKQMPEDVLVQGWFSLTPSFQNIYLAIKQALLALKTNNSSIPLGTLSIHAHPLQNTNWEDKWKDFYKPFKPGKTLVIKATWEAYEPQEGEQIIEIDPGMAFGTGSHETTSMCISFLEKYVTPQMTVADIGTGSGILAISAGLLGAKEVLAVDIDPNAVKVAKENVVHHHLSQIINVAQGDLLSITNSSFDLCVANIIAEIIVLLASPLKKNLMENGLFICSGILKEKATTVKEALFKEGYSLLEENTQGEWTAMVWKT